MKRKLLISRIWDRYITAIVENETVREFRVAEDVKETQPQVGDIYIGRVKNIVPNIQAAFIEIAPHLECYFAYGKMKQACFTKKIGKKPLCIGDELLVQVEREAIKTKQPAVTANINLTGAYLVLTTSDTRTGVSSKIDGEDRVRLKEWIEPFANASYGFVVRTNALHVPKEALDAEAKKLIASYEELVQKGKTRTCFSCLQRARMPYLKDLQDIRLDGLEEILVEDPSIYEEVRSFLEAEYPDMLEKLHKYEDAQLPMHKFYSLEHRLKEALHRQVWLKSGGYLVIEPTEALTVIDVNSGKAIGKKAKEETALKLNLEAVKEAAAQIRLRNLSGIILIDLINMEQKEHLVKVEQAIRELLRTDVVPADFIEITKLQLAEITRKKVRKPLHEYFVKNEK